MLINLFFMFDFINKVFFLKKICSSFKVSVTYHLTKVNSEVNIENGKYTSIKKSDQRTFVCATLYMGIKTLGLDVMLP